MAVLKHFRNREISWLSFNERVLQEAADETNPLIERLRFLGIFSNNLDEFYRVRVASLNRMIRYKTEPPYEFLGCSPKKILQEISKITKKQQQVFAEIYNNILLRLHKENIHIISERQLTEEQGEFVRNFFREKVRMHLFPIMMNNVHNFSNLRDKSIYLAVHLQDSKKKIKENIALIELPTEQISRFVILPEIDEHIFIILLDDVVRFCLDEIFAMFGYDTFDAYTIKFTRDAELDLDNDISKSFLEIMQESIKQRKVGDPIRFIYDEDIPSRILKRLVKSIGITRNDMFVPGGRYHNFKDFIFFPPVGRKELRYEPLKEIPHPLFNFKQSIFEIIKKQDILLHFPYQPFQHIIDFLREASIDPHVVSIKMTLYRLAKPSSIINALINAARNGKKVTVFIEIQARFDEEANIEWAQQLHEAGVHIIQNLPSLKVHCKLLLIKRRERNKIVYYTNISTGNFNEVTAKLYCDESLLTANQKIGAEVEKVFDSFESYYKEEKYKHLIVAPNYMRNKLYSLIDNEIKNVKKGGRGEIILKLNNLVDPDMARKLIAASQAGVIIKIIVRGTFVIIPKIPGYSDNISAVSIVDRFLEHSRIFYFYSGGEEKIYISSADLMTRNLDRRVEVMCPIYDPKIKERLKKLLEIQFTDNVKARYLGERLNQYKRENLEVRNRSQETFYEYLKQQYSS